MRIVEHYATWSFFFRISKCGVAKAPALALASAAAALSGLDGAGSSLERTGSRRGVGVGPRHGANSGGGNETHFRPAGGLKNIVYENRGAFDKFIIL